MAMQVAELDPLNMWMVTVPSGGDTQTGLCYRIEPKETHGDEEERLPHMYKWF